MRILTGWKQKIQYKTLWRRRGESHTQHCPVCKIQLVFSFNPSGQPGLISLTADPYSEAETNRVQEAYRPFVDSPEELDDPSLAQFRVSPLTPPSEASSPFSPGERRDSNDSQDISQSGRNQSTGKAKRLGKDEKLARAEGIIQFISVHDIINLPMGRFVKIIPGFY